MKNRKARSKDKLVVANSTYEFVNGHLVLPVLIAAKVRRMRSPVTIARARAKDKLLRRTRSNDKR